ncbi:DNA repair protein [Bordetella genomosp. 13]|uniref:DNA repair protein n=1 Tax=Bordetella genomosp. 13 TaxID=463040 RepID=UPI0021B59F29|nr:DNA repair protein [Bordetella genomosp. 13]
MRNETSQPARVRRDAAQTPASPALRQAAWALKATAAAMATMLTVFPAHAQSMEERLRTQLRSATQQLQQLQSQQAQLTAAKTAAETQRDAAQKEVEQLRAQLGKAQGQAEQLSQQQDAVRDAARAQAAASNEQIGKFKAAYDELLGIARAKDAEGKKLQAALTERDSQFKLCQQKNDQMYAAGKEILSAYESFSTGDLLSIRQPLAREARVQFDEKAQEYGDKLYDGKYDPRMAPAKPAGEPPAK